jgi:hypothetical protein
MTQGVFCLQRKGSVFSSSNGKKERAFKSHSISTDRNMIIREFDWMRCENEYSKI